MGLLPRARWKRRVPRVISTAPQKLDAHPSVGSPDAVMNHHGRTSSQPGPPLCQTDPHLISEVQDVLFAFFVLRRGAQVLQHQGGLERERRNVGQIGAVIDAAATRYRLGEM